jgi:hypothetical protein
MSFSDQAYQAAFGDMERSAALRQNFLKTQRESPDFRLFAPVKEVTYNPTVNQDKIANIPKYTENRVEPAINSYKQIQPDAQKAIVSKSWTQNAAKAIVSAIKAVVVEIRRVVNVVTGQIFGIISGDSFKKQEPFRFDPAPGKPAVIGATGMLSNRNDMETMRRIIQKAFGVSDVVMVRNNTGPLRLLSDALQTLGYEIFGSRDKPVRSMQNAMRQGIKEKGEVYVVSHSQSGAIVALALRGLSKDERSHVHIWNGGSEWAIDAKKYGLASVRNVKNAGDPIPNIANKWNPTNWINPFRFSRIAGDWEKITVKESGNHHNFPSNYSEDMNVWAKERLK